MQGRIAAALAALWVAFAMVSCGGDRGFGTNSPYWAQWSYSAAHDGQVSVTGSALNSVQADIIYDPFVSAEQAESGGGLVVHYPSTLTDGNDFYLETKSGSYVSCSPPGSWQNGAACGPNAWAQMIWNVAHYQWQAGKAVALWLFASDWKPPPNGQGLSGWEPVFHAALANGALYIPGAGGTIWKVEKTSGQVISHLDPFASSAVNPAHAFLTGPLTVDLAGNLYFNAVELTAAAATDPWIGADVVSAWLVKVSPQDVIAKVSYTTLVPGAPPAQGSTCAGEFNTEPLPWPPDPNAQPASVRCGSQRPGINISPAIGADGTIFTVSRAHYDEQTAYVIAVNPDLTPKWQASLEHRLNDGCGVVVPIAADLTTPNACRPGAAAGVDPRTNALGSGHVTDLASSTPVALPDGGVLYGALTYYNALRGHLFRFDGQGRFVGSYPFGWDSTPALYRHGTSYSILIKDNHYDAAGLYCFSADPHCAPLPAGPYLITQLDADLNVEWQFQNITTDANHSNGYEWCINAPVVDTHGVVYVNSEDGYIYALGQGHNGLFTVPVNRHFLKRAVGAAYTPLSMGPDGRVYTQNDGHLFALGS